MKFVPSLFLFIACIASYSKAMEADPFVQCVKEKLEQGSQWQKEILNAYVTAIKEYNCLKSTKELTQQPSLIFGDDETSREFVTLCTSDSIIDKTIYKPFFTLKVFPLLEQLVIKELILYKITIDHLRNDSTSYLHTLPQDITKKILHPTKNNILRGLALQIKQAKQQEEAQKKMARFAHLRR